MNQKKIVESIEDANCINCLNSTRVDDEYYCYYPRDPDERHEVGESDFCQECVTWAMIDNTRLKLVDHEDVVFQFGGMSLESTVTSTLQPPQPQFFDTGQSEDARC